MDENSVKIFGEMHKGANATDLWIHFRDSEVTVKEVLDKLEREAKIKIDPQGSSIIILVNGRRAVFLGGFDARLKDMDEVVVMPIMSGG